MMAVALALQSDVEVIVVQNGCTRTIHRAYRGRWWIPTLKLSFHFYRIQIGL
jgi:hypothetical protein